MGERLPSTEEGGARIGPTLSADRPIHPIEYHKANQHK